MEIEVGKWYYAGDISGVLFFRCSYKELRGRVIVYSTDLFLRKDGTLSISKLNEHKPMMNSNDTDGIRETNMDEILNYLLDGKEFWSQYTWA